MTTHVEVCDNLICLGIFDFENHSRVIMILDFEISISFWNEKYHKGQL